MKHTFEREGKVLSCTEMTELLGNMIEKHILSELDYENLQSFYVKLFNVVYQEMKVYLECRNYKIVNERQCFITGAQKKVISNLHIWYDALEKAKNINNGIEVKNLAEFIEEFYYPEMKMLIIKLQGQ